MRLEKLMEKMNTRYYVEEYKRNARCKSCGGRESLTFHHRNPYYKFKDISRMICEGKSIQMVRREMEKCDVMCLACHRKLHNLVRT